MKFRILPDNIQSVTTIFNSKTTSVSPKDFNVDFARIDILDESIDEINGDKIILGSLEEVTLTGNWPKKYGNNE